MSADALSGGFADPVFQSQAVFRALLGVLSRPGTIARLPDHVRPPPPLKPSTGSVLCALADADTAVFVDCAAEHHDQIATWIGFHSGARLAIDPAEATFVVIADGRTMPALTRFRQGTPEYPDRSATVIVQLDDFSGATPLVLEGPGIPGTIALNPRPLPDGLVRQLAMNRRLFPRGVDIVLAAPDAIAGLPRTTRVLEAGDAGCT